MVLNIPLLYDVIVGRDWVHKIKGVASILHQVIKFVIPKGKETLYGDQVVAN